MRLKAVTFPAFVIKLQSWISEALLQKVNLLVGRNASQWAHCSQSEDAVEIAAIIQNMTVEHVDRALDECKQHGFPADSFELLRVFFLALTSMGRETGCPSVQGLDEAQLRAIAEQRVARLVQLEERQCALDDEAESARANY